MNRYLGMFLGYCVISYLGNICFISYMLFKMRKENKFIMMKSFKFRMGTILTFIFSPITFMIFCLELFKK